MTQPTVIYFGPEGGVPPIPKRSKVFFRTLLYATSKKGRIIESMYVRLTHHELREVFNIWTYGDKEYSRGSGLFVPENGVAANHNFLLPSGRRFLFTPGKYVLEIFASLVGEKPTCLFSTELTVSENEGLALAEDHGVYFDWSADTGSYNTHVDKRPKSEWADLLGEKISPLN